jgi:ubiquinone/menaquinone biosynthesis C-methylase UbiE
MDGENIMKYYGRLFDEGQFEQCAENTDREPVERFFREIDVSGKRILDLGCGTGSIADVAQAVTSGWSSYIGIDAFAPALEKFNHRKFPNAQIEVSAVTALSNHADDSADIVVRLFLLQDLNPNER